MVHGLPQRRRAGRRQFPQVGDARQALLQRRRDDAEGRPDRQVGIVVEPRLERHRLHAPTSRSWRRSNAIKDGFTPDELGRPVPRRLRQLNPAGNPVGRIPLADGAEHQ